MAIRRKERPHLIATRMLHQDGRPYWRFTNTFGDFVTDCHDIPLVDAIARMNQLADLHPKSVDWYDDVDGKIGTWMSNAPAQAAFDRAKALLTHNQGDQS